MVGKVATLRIKVLVPTWFTSPSIYPSFEKLNMITRLPPNSTYPITETINGDNWSGIIREYEIYPQSVGLFDYQSRSIQVHYADEITRAPIKANLSIPGVELKATLPPGAESLNPFLASSKVTLNREIKGNTDNIKTGDAIVIELTAEIENMPAMFLPVLLRFPESLDYTIYPEEAVIEDHREARNIGTSGSRKERITIIFENPGIFVIPEIKLMWWNTTTKAIETSILTRQSFEVRGEPISIPAGEVEPTIYRLATLSTTLLILLGLLIMARGRISSRLHQRKADYLKSEPYLSKCVIQSILSGDKKEVYLAYLLWKGRIEENDTYQFNISEFESIAQDLFGDTNAPSTLNKEEKKFLIATLKKNRREMNSHRKQHPSSLPALNR